MSKRSTPRPKIVGICVSSDGHDYYVLECGHLAIIKHGVTRPRANVKRTPCLHCYYGNLINSAKGTK